MKHRIGLWIAIAALCVNAPRLVQAFLEADGLRLSEPLRPLLMGSTGVAAALTLTGGSAWLAHELARGSYRAGERLQGLLLSCWLLVLVGQLVLIPPLLMAELASSRLGTVLTTSWQRWGWCFTAVLLVELVAAGAMMAQGRRAADKDATKQQEHELERIARERNALEQKLRAAQEHRRLTSEPNAGASLLQPRAGAAEHKLSKATGAPRYPCRHGCGWVGKSPRAENAHLRFCPVREDQ